MKMIDGLSGQEPLTCEAGGWITCRVPYPGMAVVPPQLLARSALSRSGNFRFSIVDRQVLLIGEVRDPDGWLSVEDARARLFGPAQDPTQAVSPVEVTCVLAETGYEWSQPESDPNRWCTVAAGPSGHRCELTASIISNGVEVTGRLGSWDVELSGPSRTAMARFLAAAHGQIRFARFTLQEPKPTRFHWPLPIGSMSNCPTPWRRCWRHADTAGAKCGRWPTRPWRAPTWRPLDRIQREPSVGRAPSARLLFIRFLQKGTSHDRH